MKIDKLIPDHQILQELGRRLSLNRKQRSLTQEQLAEMAGVGVATLRRIEDGRDGQIGSWIKILKALNLEASIDQLLPEQFSSPMAEAKAIKKRAASRAQINEQNTKFSWGDEAE